MYRWIWWAKAFGYISEEDARELVLDCYGEGFDSAWDRLHSTGQISVRKGKLQYKG